MSTADEIQAQLEQAVAEDPGDLEAYLALGCLHLREGHLEPALAALEQATRLAPGDERGWHYLAHANALAERFGETLRCLGHVDSPGLLRGRALLGLERFEEALAELQGQAEAEELLAEALQGRARRHWETPSALEDLLQACRVHPEDAAGWVLLGQWLAGQRRWADALGAYERALDLGWSPAAVKGALAALEGLERPFEALRLLVRYEPYDRWLSQPLNNALVGWLTPRWEALVIPAGLPFRRDEVIAAARAYGKPQLAGDALVLPCARKRIELLVRVTENSLEVVEVHDATARLLAEREARRAELPPLERPAVATGRVQYIPELSLAKNDKGERFGGHPWGLPLKRWPVCAECGGAQTFLGQLDHHPPRLDLGGEGRRAFVFLCQRSDRCPDWEAFSGSNAVLILAAGERTQCLTPAPEGTPLLREVAIRDWLRVRDPIPAERAPNFLDRQLFLAEQEQPDDGTRLGGSPCWNIDPEVPAGFTFAGQFAELHELWGDPPAADPEVQPHPRGFTLVGPDFRGGLGYLFLKGGEGAFCSQS